MATVFLAEDERLGRLVAVKRLHGESSEEVARRFRREARLGAALNHSNVVAVYDITSDDEGTLIVMEYVEGQTLRDELGDGRIPAGRAIAILRGVASALDYAHENGVVHRDIKPANILIRRDGVVKLADLGIATAAEQSKITRSGSVLGTAAYMAPERLDGKPGGPSVDVYALAAVAFEMLCGRKAYEGNTPLEVAHKVVNEPTPDLRRCLPDAPDPLADALKRGLAWEPEERPATAGDLVAAIEAALPEAAEGAIVEALPGAAAAGAAGGPPLDAREPHDEEGADAAADTDGTATPARVLPPERTRTRTRPSPTRAAGAAMPAEAVPADGAAPADAPASPEPAAAAPAQAPASAEPAAADATAAPASETAAPSPDGAGRSRDGAGGSPDGAGRPPELADRVDGRSRRRWDLPIVAAVLGVLALLAIVLITAGGNDSDPAGGGDRAEQASPKASSDENAGSGEESGTGGGESGQGEEGSGGGSAPATPEAGGAGGGGDGGAAPAAGTPEAAVNDFYTRAARDDYEGAWALATPRAQQKLGGFASFRAGQSSLESITFPKLKGKQSGDTASVTLNSQAVHESRIDRCKGSIDLVRSGGAWKLDDFHIANCAQTPRP
jgi:serine/threonine-protein kinase